jgi:sugar lactone lactonase YvrE
LYCRDTSIPYGIAFSSDEKYLYVGNWDEKTKVVMRYEAKADRAFAARSATVPMRLVIAGIRPTEISQQVVVVV